MTDFVIIIGLTLGACLLVGVLGALAMHRLRGRSLRYQLIIATLLPVAAVTATVIVNVWLMFLSPHDSTVIVIALIVAVLVAAFGNLLVLRRVGRGSAELSVALARMRADSTGTPAPTTADPTPDPAPGGARPRRRRSGGDPTAAGRDPAPRAGRRGCPPRARPVHVP